MEEVYGSMALKTEKRYTYEDILALPEDVRAELIDGQIYYMSTPARIHQALIGELFFRIQSYIKEQKGNCKTYVAPFGVYLDEKTDTYLEPDIVVICNPDILNDRGCKGAPDLVIEVLSPSTHLKDKVLKLNKYCDNGVREYWMVDPKKKLTTVWNFSTGEEKIYNFTDVVPVGIYEDFSIDFSELDIPS